MAEKWKRKHIKRLNQIADVIRQHKRISIPELAFELDMGFTTLQYYKPLVLKLFDDIAFERGEFYVK